MNARSRGIRREILASACVVCVLLSLGAFATSQTKNDEKSVSAQPDKGRKRLTVDEARERARLLHNIYAATLDSMHHHFFRRERSVLPARALEDVFADMERQSKIKANWISVNTKAMSINHRPKTEFEKNAAREIAAGKGQFELVEDGVYRRAGAIPLGSGCVNCHTGFFSKTPKTQRFAGLVISVPITE